MKRRCGDQKLPEIAAHGVSRFEVESALTLGLLSEAETKTVTAELRHVVVGRIPNGRPMVAVCHLDPTDGYGPWGRDP